MELKNLSDKDLIKLYPALLKELRVRGIAKTKNVVGELGEYITKRIYSETPNFPKLQDAPASTKNIDAISVRGKDMRSRRVQETTLESSQAFHLKTMERFISNIL